MAAAGHVKGSWTEVRKIIFNVLSRPGPMLKVDNSMPMAALKNEKFSSAAVKIDFHPTTVHSCG